MHRGRIYNTRHHKNILYSLQEAKKSCKFGSQKYCQHIVPAFLPTPVCSLCYIIIWFFNYYRSLNFNLQVITDSNRQLARLFGKVQIFLYRKLVLSILHCINPYPVAITDQPPGFRMNSCVWLHASQVQMPTSETSSFLHTQCWEGKDGITRA